MASLKNKAGATFARFTSECERVLERISRRNGNDVCVKCGDDMVLVMTDDGYVCHDCLDHLAVNQDSRISNYKGMNDLGRTWSFD